MTTESKPRWTPGPAHVIDQIDVANHGRRVVASGRVVAECSALDPETNQANATLFAAAYDLVAAVEAIIAEPYGCPACDSGVLRNDAREHWRVCGFAMGKAAIAKARKAETT